MDPVTRPSDSQPSRWVLSASSPRMNKVAPVSSTTAMANCPTINAWRNRWWPRETVAPRPPLLRVSLRFKRSAKSEGAKLKIRAVKTEHPKVQVNTTWSIAITTWSPLSAVLRTCNQSAKPLATPMAQSPPASESNKDSSNNGRRSCARDAPRADRTANSRARDMVRASRKLARLEQQISTTKPDKPTSIARTILPFSPAARSCRLNGCHVAAAFSSG